MARDAAQPRIDLAGSTSPRPRGKVRPLTEHERKLLAKGSLERCFPLKFKSGLVMEELVGECRVCTSAIPPQDMRGTVGWFEPDRVAITAIGGCRGCRVATCFVIRINGKGEFSTIIGDRWRTGSFKASVIQRLRRAFNRWCRRMTHGA